ncbi:MAG: hypothetical protein AB1374_06260 [Bacillota bacterium]
MLAQALVTINPACAAEDDGNIDFFKVFAKDDENIDRIGSRIYNWSIYLPSAAEIFKNSKATDFNMFISNAGIEVSVQVLKNVNNLTLEEIYALLTTTVDESPYSYHMWKYDLDHVCSAKIEYDKYNNRFINITSVIPAEDLPAVFEYDYDDLAGTYREQRVYLGQKNNINYIYLLDISMDLEFFSQHKGLFLKIADSFRTNFNEQNPNLKDLSDQVTVYRTYHNRMYGWEIELAPYWKSQGHENAKQQVFIPLYSDKELGSGSDSQDTIEEPADYTADTLTDRGDNESKDFLKVTVVSSIPTGESFDDWIRKEIKGKQLNYKETLYQQLGALQEVRIPNGKGKLLISRIRTNSIHNMIEGLLLVQGNGYRYQVVLRISESKYAEKEGNETFYRMIKSFRPCDTKSKFVGDFWDPESIYDFEGSKVVSMKKYNLTIVTGNSWINPDGIWEGMIDNESEDYEGYSSGQGLGLSYFSNFESLDLTEVRSGARLSIQGVLTSRPLEEIMKEFLEALTLVEREESKGQISTVSVQKSKIKNDITIYRVVENHNIANMEALSRNDSKKVFNYEETTDTYVYIFKVKDDLYFLEFSIPLISASQTNIEKLREVWQEVTVNDINVGRLATKWEAVDTNQRKTLFFW